VLLGYRGTHPNGGCIRGHFVICVVGGIIGGIIPTRTLLVYNALVARPAI
jgi:hypothetical protein